MILLFPSHDPGVRRTVYAVGPSPDHLILCQSLDFDKDLIENMRVENRVKAAVEKAKETTKSFKDARKRIKEEGIPKDVH